MSEMVLFGILIVASVGLIVYSLWPAKKAESDHIRRRMAGRRLDKAEALLTVAPKRERSAAKEMIEKVAPIAMRPVMPASEEEMNKLRSRLSQAGYRSEAALRYFLASKTIMGGGVLLVALLFAMGMGLETRQIFGIAAFAGGIGFMLPNFWLSLAQSSRQERIRNGLPDVLDLMVVSVESGLGLDAAIMKVGEDMHNVHPELAEEMMIAVAEGQMGLPRMEALEKMAARCGVDEVRALVSTVAQAEKFGTSIAKALRTQADSLRVKRRLRAEERAQKTTVKLMAPLILFIFPSIFVVLAGPAAMKLVAAFSRGGISGAPH
ncbi:MAG TPA: type II secretion system F family protein [Phycisphaerae bacterium]|nr:type II secretion system F family protein [Phycisphaerae bacterium]HRR83635.1 type II secretion system F family protein [Phycisphaerae bacterium]